MKPIITLYNTLSRKEETFNSIKEDIIGIYSCGPTVYHYAHIGNLRAYVFADILRRSFLYAGYTVKHIINITDVGHLVGDGDEGEDKLEAGAKREGKTAWEIAKFYEEAFMEDLKLLNIPTEAYIFPRATENIQEQIDIISTLEKQGYTYKITDGVYFDTSLFSHYADLAKLDVKGLQSGARVEENKEKKNITDFALWKFSPLNETRQMEWQSPWGKGFPGWHIECSAMSMKSLGNHFDIHTGGIDHIPVHHTNEIAQSECATGVKYVNYWMHVNFLNDQSGKMSKSKEDFLRLKTIIDENISALAYRYYLLTTHYRAEIAFSFTSLKGATSAYEKLCSWVLENRALSGNISEEYKKEFDDYIFNDVGTPQAVALIWKLLKDEAVMPADKYKTILSWDEVLGLGLKDLVKEVVNIPREVQSLLDERLHAKESKDWAKSDELRTKIEALGFSVKDTKDGQEVSHS